MDALRVAWRVPRLFRQPVLHILTKSPPDLDRLRSDEHQRRLAELVAQLHLASAPISPQYGFPIPTCCGATVQDNTEERDWATFFGERRIGDLIRRIGDGELEKLGGEVQRR